MKHLRGTTRAPLRQTLVFATSLAVVAASLLAMGTQAFAVDKFAVQKTADNPSITAGQNASFTIVATAINTGTGNIVENFTLTDQLPAGTWTVGGPDVGACSINGSNLLTCLFGNVPEGQTRTVTVSRVTTTADCNTTINNTATVISDDIIFESGTDLLNNTSTASIAVTCAPPPPPSAQITPTGTTCQQFRDGTASNLAFIEYSLRRDGTIGQVDPGVGFYFVEWTWSGASISIVQTDNGSTPAFGVHFVQVYLASDCGKLTSGLNISTGTTTTIGGSAFVTGTLYIALLSFDPKAVDGSGTPSPTTVTYTYTTPGVAGSTQSIPLQPK